MELSATGSERPVQGEGDQNELGLAAKLFKATMESVSAILKIIAKSPSQQTDSSIVFNKLCAEFQKFYIWNEGFPTSSGSLDRILLCSKNLRATVLGHMVQWAKVLCRIPKVLLNYAWSEVLQELAELEVLANTIDQVAAAAAKEIETRYAVKKSDKVSDYDSDSDSDSSSFVSVGDFEDILEDLKVYTESLTDLTPSLENPANDLMIGEHLNTGSELFPVAVNPDVPDFTPFDRQLFASLKFESAQMQGIHVNEESSSSKTNPTSQFSEGLSYTTNLSSVSGSGDPSPRPGRLTEDSTFMRYEVPNDTFKAVICNTGCHAAFISKKLATVIRIGGEGTWVTSPKPPIDNDDSRICLLHCPDGFKWDFASLSGQYLLLKSKKLGSRELRIHIYNYDESQQIWREEPLTNFYKAYNTLDISISNRGDLLYVSDAQLWFYSRSDYRYLELFSLGRHRTSSCCFSPDGRWVFGWSHQMENHFFKWDTLTRVPSATENIQTLKCEWHIILPHTAPLRGGSEYPATFPFLNYFVVFDIPDRVYIVGKDTKNPQVVKLPEGARDVMAGVSIQGNETGRAVESLILLQKSGNGSLKCFPMNLKSPGTPIKASRLRYQFVSGKDALSVLCVGSKYFVIIAHVDGRLEKQRILT